MGTGYRWYASAKVLLQCSIYNHLRHTEQWKDNWNSVVLCVIQVRFPMDIHEIYPILWWSGLPWLSPLCWRAKPKQFCICLHLLWLHIWNRQGIIICLRFFIAGVNLLHILLMMCSFFFISSGLPLSEESPATGNMQFTSFQNLDQYFM